MAIDEVVEMDEEAAASPDWQNSVVGSPKKIRAAKDSRSSHFSGKCHFDIWETEHSFSSSDVKKTKAKS